jgi:hypothetical protein
MNLETKLIPKPPSDDSNPRYHHAPSTARPLSAYSRKSSASLHTKSAKDLSTSRSRPKNISYDKESLYDSLVAAKSEISNLNQENLRLRTRVKFLETEMARIELNKPQPKSMLVTLKRMYKD